MGGEHRQGNRSQRAAMKSGLRDRNNQSSTEDFFDPELFAAMKSGLRDRNNLLTPKALRSGTDIAAMKSGLRDRNNGRA